MSLARQRELELHAAFACYMDARPFTMYEGEYTKKFMQTLNPDFRLPSAFRLANTLLDEAYVITKNEVDSLIAKEQTLHIVTDESTNISHQRICNLIALTARGPLFISHLQFHGEELNAERQMNFLVERLKILTGGQLSRINSLSTDTCNTMRKLWRLIKQRNGLKHILCAPCDSHGLQLLVKDILTNLSELTPTVKQANQVVSYFHRAVKQYERLRQYQMEIYQEHRSLTLAGMTRWGTNFLTVKSLLHSREALAEYCANIIGDDTDKEIYQILNNQEFWDTVGFLFKLLDPINKEQIASEGNDAHLGLVKARWDRLHNKFKMIERECPIILNWELFWKEYDKRRTRQLTKLHTLAHYLMPENWKAEWKGNSLPYMDI